MANTKTQWRPGFWYDYDEYGRRLNKSEYVRFATYRELKKKLPEYLKHQSEIHVSRSKRSEWGEFAETWILINGKPKIIKSGWM